MQRANKIRRPNALDTSRTARRRLSYSPLAMTELRQVTGAKPMDDTKVYVTFDNGVSGVFDCAPYMEESYWQCLKSPSFFRQVKAEYGTLCWPNDIDIDPEEVWQDAIRTSTLQPS